MPARSLLIAPTVQPKCELHLTRDGESAWRDLVRPWLQIPGNLRRDFVLVPTRGQAAALKLRCVRENVPLLGVEFLTPALARKKWLALATQEPAATSRLKSPALGREFLLLGLRLLIERRLAPLALEDPSWGLWKSLQSDPERALDAFDELLQAGFTAGDFPLDPLRMIFTELAAWVESLGYTLAPWQAEAAGITKVLPGALKLGERLLVWGFTAECWSEFFSLAALLRRVDDLTIILPEPELRGAKASDEKWIEIWTAILGAEAQVSDATGAPPGGAAVAALWTGEQGSSDGVEILVGHSRADEMELVADKLAQLVAGGADNVAVIFPRADAAHLRLAQLLAARAIPFTDLLETAGPPPIDGALQRALLAFYERGGRLEELMAMWPLLQTLSFVQQPPGVVRGVCERLFDESQTHVLSAYQERLAASERVEWQEISRVAGMLLPAWPAEITLADAAQRFETVGARFKLQPPATWPALVAFAQREIQLLPARCLFPTLAAFLPDKVPVENPPGRGRFAPITLTTRRRAAGVAWSHLILVESNAGVWPGRAEPGAWLNDEQRRALNERSRFSLGLFTSDERAALEKQSYVALARHTREQVIFSAALYDEEEPELRLAPNPWLERVLIARGLGPSAEDGIEEAFARLVRPPRPVRKPNESDPWLEIWRRRRDPGVPFDDYFLSGPPAIIRPARLAARLIERAIQDPAELWFAAVLGARRVEWQPLVRARKKALGQLAHHSLALAMRGEAAGGIFRIKPTENDARATLAVVLVALRSKWPRDRYWDSLHGELSELCHALLRKVFTLPSGGYVAIEARVPEGAKVPVGENDWLAVDGRMDLVLLDRPTWVGAQVDIIDFKTGADARFSAKKMAKGGSLQLGIYLAAAASLGVAGGRVWMIKPGAGTSASIDLIELPEALTGLIQLGQHLATGRYGALTPDRTEFSHGFEWPLACSPVRHAVLAKKFALTFGMVTEFDHEESADE